MLAKVDILATSEVTAISVYDLLATSDLLVPLKVRSAFT